MESKRMKIISIVMIVIAVAIIAVCGIYLYGSQKMISKYDVESFKIGEVEVPSFNSAVKKKKKLLYAGERDGIITLKYDISDIKLNDVLDYLSKLSKDDYVVVNFEDLYMRTINEKKDIQIKVKITSNHLIFEYKSGIDTAERINKKNDEKFKEELNEVNKEQTN